MVPVRSKGPIVPLALLPLLQTLAGCADRGQPEASADPEGDGPLAFTAVTFNGGTTEGLPHDRPPDDGYTGEHAAISDRWYGDGLAWVPAGDGRRLLRPPSGGVHRGTGRRGRA